MRGLEREGWLARHDLDRSGKGNFDHVLVGPAGVFLLDSKNFAGDAALEGDELVVRPPDDPWDDWSCPRLVQRMRAASAGLKGRIEDGTDVRVWVQPVVVLWGGFPQRVACSSDVWFVKGTELKAWLRQRPPRNSVPEAVRRFVVQMPRAGMD